MTDIGVTATRLGLTPKQLKMAAQLLVKFSLRVPGFPHFLYLRHGDCVGGDEALNKLARDLGYTTIAFPPSDARHRAYSLSDQVRDPRPYAVRNQAIVDTCEHLLVFPSGPEADNPRSGTWQTYRMGLRRGIPVTVVMP